MSKQLNVSNADIRSQKCCLCNLLLSVPPIMTADLERELYKCGRCEKVKCQVYTRNRLFESLAQHLSFPCSYLQCDEKIPWGWVEAHELNCRYRTIKCPIYYHNCSEMVPVNKLEAHFKEKHRKNVRTVGDPWDVSVSLDYVFLVQVEGKHFFVYILHLDEIFSVAVLSVERSRYTKFSVKLLPSTGDNFTVTFDDLPVVRYNERSHCYMCIRRKCKEPHHPFSEKNSKEPADLGGFTSKLKKEFIHNVKSSNGELKYQIKLIADQSLADEIVADRAAQLAETAPRRTEEEQSTSRIPSQANMESIKSFLSCPYCMTYMASPIYTCSVGHTICNVCRPRYTKCPTCAAPLGDSRNYSLEKMAEEVEMPCQNDGKGCTFAGNSTKMYFHEQECEFGTLKE